MRVHITHIEDEGPQPRGLSLGGVPTQRGSPWLQTPCSEENWLNLPSGGAPLILSSNLICGHVRLTVEKFLSTEVFHWVRVLPFEWWSSLVAVCTWPQSPHGLGGSTTKTWFLGFFIHSWTVSVPMRAGVPATLSPSGIKHWISKRWYYSSNLNAEQDHRD